MYFSGSFIPVLKCKLLNFFTLFTWVNFALLLKNGSFIWVLKWKIRKLFRITFIYLKMVGQYCELFKLLTFYERDNAKIFSCQEKNNKKNYKWQRLVLKSDMERILAFGVRLFYQFMLLLERRSNLVINLVRHHKRCWTQDGDQNF